MRHSLPLLALVATSGCVRPVDRGPDLGACAEIPDGVYTYGEIGIGTCLAGPADAQFLVRGSDTWLTVTNADPFRNFTGGSLLSILMNDVHTWVERYRMSELPAVALHTESFVGRFGLDASGNQAIISSRLSEGSYQRSTDDKVWLVDLTNPAAPRYADRPFLSVGADPFAVVMDPNRGRAYVLNATGNSVSVLNTASSPASLLDPSPDSVISRATFAQVAGSDAVAEIRTANLGDEEIRRADAWSVTFIDGSTRLWAPTATATDTGIGLSRWSSGGPTWTPSRLGVELDAGVVNLPDTRDPWIVGNGASLLAYYASEGKIRTAFTDGDVGDWLVDSTPIVAGGTAWAAEQGGPCVIDVAGRATMYLDGRPAGSTASKIGVATTLDGVAWTARPAAAIAPPVGYTSISQPTALLDPNTLTVRVWASVYDGAHWRIATAQSTDDGLAFGPATVVMDLGTDDAAAPVVTVAGGRYRMWLSTSGPGGWWHATSWSWDGFTWSTPEPIFASESGLDADTPPRAAVQFDPEQSWRVRGDNVGVLGNPAYTGEIYSASGRGFELSVAAGFVAGTDVGFDLGGGLEPGSMAQVDGVDTLYATGISDDGRPRLLALRPIGSRWGVTQDSLIPPGSGGNAEGASSPVVVRTGSTWTMIYGAGHDGRFTLRRATSTDGLTWAAAGKDLLLDPPSWEAAAQLPHSITTAGDTLTLWYSGSDGTRWRVGTATSTDGGATWKRQAGRSEAWTLDVGDPGTFDDSGVRDPFVRFTGDTAQLWYSGFDGTNWSIGYAERKGAGAWVRRAPPASLIPGPSLTGAPLTFSALGVRSPVVVPDGDTDRLWYSGTDGVAWRLGDATARSGELYPRQRFPLSGDSFTFDTHPGEPGRSQIQLGRQVGRLVLPGAVGGPTAAGPSAGALDVARGMLWVVSDTFPGLIAIDVRDDSTATFDDRNFLDIEAAVRITSTTGLLGFHEIVVGPDGLLYAAGSQPDAIFVIDPSNLVDNAGDDVIDAKVVGVLPMHDATDDQGEETFAFVGAAGLAFVPGKNLLLATHFRDNSVSVFDLSLGSFGEEIRHIANVGENPTVVRVSPDGSYAVITNYLGEADGDVADSSLALLDLIPTSPTYLQITTRIANR